MRTMTLVLVTLMSIPAGLLAQDPGQEQSPAARIQATMETAAEAGIPVSLLESKLEEGRAKGVAEARIAAALNSRLDALIHARETMQRGQLEGITAGDLSVAADALEAGVSESALLGVQTSAPGESRVVATAVLSALVRLGRASEEALTRVRAALEGGPGALADLRAETAGMLRARGLVPPVGLEAGVGVGAGRGVGVGERGGAGGG
ncbi:MAG TPA: hypothetical protein VE173_03850 [Longimicrobiales bacterium]|nr:hypothetical protein [Longimicrobiales bacterium]